MPTDSSFSASIKSKEAWGKNIITIALLGGVALLALFYWGLILPWLIDVMSNTLELAGLGVGLFALLYAVFDPRMRNLISYAYASLTRALTGFFIEIDPIGILKTYVSHLKGYIAEMDEAIGQLRGQVSQIKDRIDKNESERVHCLERAKNAKTLADRGVNVDEMRGEFTLNGRQAGRMEESNKKLNVNLAKLNRLLADTVKMRGTSDVLMRDMENTVQNAIDDYKASRAAWNVFTRVQKVMASGGAEKELVDETFSHLADDYAMKMGTIENILETSKSVVAGIDLDNMSFDASATAQLEAWEKKGGVLSVPPEAKVRVSGEEAPPEDEFSDLFQSHEMKK
jgi:hypothetical protein